MSVRSPLNFIARSGISFTRTTGRAGPSRLLSTSPTTENRPTPAQSLGDIFEETWGSSSSVGAGLGLSSADKKDVKADLRAAGLSTSIADSPPLDRQSVDGAQGRALYRPGYAAQTRPPRTDPLLELFTNLLMKHGRKAEAQKRIGEVLDVIRQTTLSDPVPLLHQAIHLTSPSIRIVSLRRAAKNVPIPSALDARQRARTGISWILKASEKGRKGGASERTGRIAKEVLAVLDGSSAALARKDEVHRSGAVNRSNLNTR